MDGITVLAEKNIYNYLLPDNVILVLIILFAVSLAGILVWLIKESESKIIYVLITTAALCFIVSLGSILIPNKNSIKYKEYKVLIDEDVSFQEVYNKYEIIDKDGEIYTIREKQ